jgi:hypothetical protein
MGPAAGPTEGLSESGRNLLPFGREGLSKQPEPVTSFPSGIVPPPVRADSRPGANLSLEFGPDLVVARRLQTAATRPQAPRDRWNAIPLRSLQSALRGHFHCDKNRSFKFASKGKPEFHAEWLRDEPCDATTTCPRKTGVWCQLLPATAGNMRFGVVSALFAEAARI